MSTPKELVSAAAAGADVELIAPFRLPELVVDGLAVVLSHFFGTRGLGHGAYLCNVLRRYAHTAVKQRVAGPDGPRMEILTAPCPNVASAAAAPDARNLARYRGLTTQGIKDMWEHHQHEHGLDAPLDTAMLAEFVPADLWIVLGAVIAEGPKVAAARITHLLAAEAKRPIRADRRHQDAGEWTTISPEQIRRWTAAARALVATLKELADSSLLLANGLHAWTTAPTIRRPATDQRATDTSAPARWQIRALWQRVNADVTRRLPDGYATEREAITALTRFALLHGGLWTPMRLRTLVLLLAVTGLRIGALSRLRVGDFKRDWISPDGERMACLATRPRKTKRDEWISPKPLPPGAAEVIECWLAFVERLARRPLRPDEPLLPALRPTQPEDILRPWGKAAIQVTVAGANSARQRRLALIARGEDPTHGYTPHTYRSYVAQAVRSLEAHGYLDAERVAVPQHWIAEALLDHGMEGLPALYGGGSKDQDRIRLAVHGTRVTWLLLTTSLGARKGPDGEAFARTLRARAALAAELERLGADVDAAFAYAPTGGRDPNGEVLARLDGLLRAHALVRRERQAFDELAAIDGELQRLRHDPARQIDLPDVEGAEPADLDAITRAELEADPPAGTEGDAPVDRRRWISAQEFAHVAAVSPATPPRWLGQGGRAPQLPFAEGDPRNPWSADRVPVDDHLGQNRRRILVDGLAASWLAADPQRQARLNALLSTPGPDSWAPEQCAAPLLAPPWMTS